MKTQFDRLKSRLRQEQAERLQLEDQLYEAVQTNIATGRVIRLMEKGYSSKEAAEIVRTSFNPVGTIDKATFIDIAHEVLA